MNDYPIGVRIERAPRRSRLWAVLSLLTIRFWALLPHFIILAFLGIAQFVAFLIAQVVVLVNGTYPAGLHGFVAGVLRWQLRVGAFLLALTDRYPPFGFQPVDEYPVDLKVTYPQRSSRLLAGLTVLFFVVSVGVLAAASSGSSFTRYETLTNLRTVVQIPHLIVLAFYGIAVFVVWIVAQFVILFTASMTTGIHDFVAGFARWSTRVSAFTYGLTDRYPPFSGKPGPQDDRAVAPGELAAAEEPRAA